jgi:hypothetical protein
VCIYTTAYVHTAAVCAYKQLPYVHTTAVSAYKQLPYVHTTAVSAYKQLPYVHTHTRDFLDKFPPFKQPKGKLLR